MNTAYSGSENAELEASLHLMHVSDCRLSYGRRIHSKACQTSDASWIMYTTFAARGKTFLLVVTWLRNEGSTFSKDTPCQAVLSQEHVK